MTSDYQAYLDDYHATHQTPEPVIARMVARATGSTLLAKTRLAEGSNESYLVTTAAGSQCLLKIALLPDAYLEQERWAMDQARAAGVPVPEVLLVAEEEGRAFMVQSAAPGRPLSRLLPLLREADRAVLWPRIGAVLYALHSVPAGGFWKRLADGEWDFPDWTAIMNSALRDRGAELPLLATVGFTARDGEEMLRLLLRYRDEFDCPRPVLCHNDFIPEHLFITDDLRVGAVVDFGDFCGDHPIHDLAFVDEDPEMDLPQLLRGYPAAWVREPQFTSRLYLQRLAQDMGYLAHFLGKYPGHPATAFHTQALRTTLDWLLENGW